MKKGWVDKRLDDLVESNVIGITKSSGEQGEDKAWPYVKMNNITRDNRFDFSSFTSVDATDEEVRKFALKDGDFLFNTRNSVELVGKSCVYEAASDDVVLFNNNIMRIRFKNGVDAKFILYAFSSKGVAERLNELKSGTTNVAAIYYKDLRELKILIPPLPEQHRIVGILDEAFDGLARATANAEQNLRNARALFESHLQSVFTQRGPEWVEKTVEEVCDRLHQGLNTAGEKIKFYETGYPIIQTRNIENGVIELDTKIKFMSEGDWKRYRDKYRPELGDVFFTNIGTIGKTAIVTDDLDYLIHWNIFKLRPRCNTITSAFLKYTLDHLTSSGFFHVLQKGGTVEFVTKKMISEAVIGVPDTVEQKKVVAQLDALAAETQRLEAIYQRKLAALDELKKSLLHQAFSGEL